MRKKILTLLFISFSVILWGQQRKELTLEALIPGGKEFFHYYPRIAEQYQWHGDRLMLLRNDSVFGLTPLGPEKPEFAFRFHDISNDPKIRGGRVIDVRFDKSGGDNLIFSTAGGSGVYDLKKRSVVSYLEYPEKSGEKMFAPDHSRLAYTGDNNLFITDETGMETAVSSEANKGIVYGQAVHRNEFGINGGIFWSPDGNKVAFYRMDETMVADYPIVDTFTRTATLTSIKYPMAGETSHRVTIGVYDIASGATVYLKTGEPKEKYLTNVAWDPDGKFIYAAELNREQNHLKMNRYDATTGDLDKTLFEEMHPRYVEPLHSVLFVTNAPDRFVWQSRRDGFNHLYLYDTSGRLLKQLTRGEWEVTAVIGFDAKGAELFYTSTQPSPIDRHGYSVNMRNGKIRRLTTAPGMHALSVSHSGRYLISRYSSHDNPGRIDLIDTKKEKTFPLAAAADPFEGIDMPSVELGTLTAADGVTALCYRMVKPAGFDSTKRYPVAVYVYGGPHSQMVQNRWRYGSGGWETYMARKGYLVFVMDNRGTSCRGAAFENVIHRQMGSEEVKDQMCGVAFLRSLPYVDTSRMGIHGWSYGGFMTISMLLRHPGVFKVGVAGGPVIDWKYYEVMYGERYMDTPQENPEGYREASLLNKAGRLQSRLLIIHGDRDPVVVQQQSLQFLKACIDAGTHPDYFVYPGHGHNMTGHDRVHLYEQITRYFEDFCK